MLMLARTDAERMRALRVRRAETGERVTRRVQAKIWYAANAEVLRQTCRECGLEDWIRAFPLRGDGSCSVDTRCRACTKAYRAAYYQRNGARERAQMAVYRATHARPAPRVACALCGALVSRRALCEVCMARDLADEIADLSALDLAYRMGLSAWHGGAWMEAA